VTSRLLPLLVAACVAVSACGGARARPDDAHVRTASGRALFGQACSACHTLSGHNDARHQGGDLRGFHASRAQLLQLAGEMPVRRPLTRVQLDAVVRFVMAVEAGRS
jgi:mono/diheme cytochrome c family protein